MSGAREFGERLKVLLQRMVAASGLTRRQLKARTGLSDHTLSRALENPMGVRLEVIPRICDAVGASFSRVMAAAGGVSDAAVIDESTVAVKRMGDVYVVWVGGDVVARAATFAEAFTAFVEAAREFLGVGKEGSREGK